MSKFLLAEASSSWMNNRVFELDLQLIVDTLIMAAAVLALYALLSYLLFNPARNMLKKRQDFIAQQLDSAAQDKKDAAAYKAEYDGKLKEVNKESEAILSASRKKALQRENEIVEEAKEEAVRIIERANKEVELEKAKVKDDVKKQMVSVASLMAGKIVGETINENKQAALIDDTLKEMGDSTWQN